jgi:hypothetical protein
MLTKKQLEDIVKDDSVETCTERCTKCMHGGFLCRRFIYIVEERKMAAETALCIATRKKRTKKGSSRLLYEQISLFDTQSK